MVETEETDQYGRTIFKAPQRPKPAAPPAPPKHQRGGKKGVPKPEDRLNL